MKKLSLVLSCLLVITIAILINVTTGETESMDSDGHDQGHEYNLIYSIDFNLSADESAFWGKNLFQAVIGGITCEANVITTVSTRIINNYQDVEIYCRDVNTIPEFSITALPKPTTRLFGSYIQNVDGKLFSPTSGEIFNFDTNRWEVSQRYNSVYLLQPTSANPVEVIWHDPRCDGLYVTQEGEFSNCIPKNNPSAVTVIGNYIWVNDGGGLNAYEKNRQKDSISLTPARTVDGADWSYFIVPIDEEIVWGGSAGGYLQKTDRCARLNFMGILSGERGLPPQNCDNGRIKEWYSVIKLDDYYLLGNYPQGNLYRLRSNSLVATRLGEATEDDFVDPNFNTYYRESQSLAHAYGYIWIGMYPWGELVQHDLLTGSSGTIRVFSSPQKDPGVPTPYFSKFIEVLGDNVKRDESAEYVYSFLSDNGESLRDLGLEPTLLGQRIPSIVVLDGRLCVSTGNLNFLEPHATVLKQVDKRVMSEYGSVKCIKLPNQMLFSDLQAGEYRIEIWEDSIVLRKEGEIIRRRLHSLAF